MTPRARTILNIVYLHGAMTDRDIAEYLNFTDMNAVRPCITELVQAGQLIVVGREADHHTGKTVRVVATSFANMKGVQQQREETFYGTPHDQSGVT
jgi:predicted transcriptional regulator